MIIFLFWVSMFLIVYTYIGFPLFILLRGLLWGQPYRHEQTAVLPSVSIVISAYNEADAIS